MCWARANSLTSLAKTIIIHKDTPQTNWLWQGVDQDGIPSFIAREQWEAYVTKRPEIAQALDLTIVAMSQPAIAEPDKHRRDETFRYFRILTIAAEKIRRGYQQFARQVAENQSFPTPIAEQKGLSDVFQAIVAWQHQVGVLSHELAAHLGTWPPQDKLMQVLVMNPA